MATFRDHKHSRDHLLEVLANARQLVDFLWEEGALDSHGEDDEPGPYGEAHEAALSVWEYLNSLADEQLRDI